MPAASRPLALAALTLLAVGCGASNNKNRIAGKWKFVSEDPRLRDASLAFGDDGRVSLVGAAPGPVGWRYKLLAGDAADFYALPPDPASRIGMFPSATGVARVTIRIIDAPGAKSAGRAMTVTDSGGRALKLVQVR
jgi:hypothetical protein